MGYLATTNPQAAEDGTVSSAEIPVIPQARGYIALHEKPLDGALWTDAGALQPYVMQVAVPMSSLVLDAVVAAEYLAPADRSNHDKVRQAIMRLIECHLADQVVHARKMAGWKADLAADSWGHSPRRP